MAKFSRRALVTGSAGFIGWHLMKSLTELGFDVRGVDNFFHPCQAPKNGTKYADVRYYHEISEYVEWADIVFHLAAQIHVDRSIEIPEETVDVNIKGTLNVLDAVTKAKKRMVFASTSEVYGSSQTDYMGEDHPLDAQSPYGASKVAADRLCKAYYDTYGTEVVILRNFNTFGPWQNDTSYGSVIAKFTRAALRGDTLQIYGDGSQVRDYMYVPDAVSAYNFLCEAGLPGQSYNAGSGQTVSVSDLARIIVGLCGSKSRIEHVDARPGEVQRLCANIDKIKELGFETKTDLEKDLNTYIKRYVQNEYKKL